MSICADPRHSAFALPGIVFVCGRAVRLYGEKTETQAIHQHGHPGGLGDLEETAVTV